MSYVAKPSGTELEALQAVKKLGGRPHLRLVGSELGVGSDYAGILCRYLGQKDFIDLLADGTCLITEKGSEALEAS